MILLLSERRRRRRMLALKEINGCRKHGQEPSVFRLHGYLSTKSTATINRRQTKQKTNS
jgi:hypothetical protein